MSFQLDDYWYDLPEERIAQHPAENRSDSRLLVLDKESGAYEITTFKYFSEFVPRESVLVVNNSKVFPARIQGSKPSGGRVEVLLLTPLALVEPNVSGEWNTARVKALTKASKKMKPGGEIQFSVESKAIEAKAIVLEIQDFGITYLKLYWKGDLKAVFQKMGSMPLPPYIKREASNQDVARYQTIYAKEEHTGSVAAPTAGLHMTDEVRRALELNGVWWTEVCLYVGYGTFSPVRCQDIRDHSMHKEFIDVPRETIAAIDKAKQQGRKVVAVGTTSVRTLEGVWQARQGLQPFSGWTDIFIYPGFRFNVVDHLLTNFHLPKSSLLMMVSALAGRERILAAYEAALRHGFRFFSYGDAMFIK